MRSVDRVVIVAGAVLVGGWVMAAASPVGACTVTAPPPDFGGGVPADDATDVPTDVIPYYPIPVAVLSEEGVPGTFTLTAGSIAVPLEVRRVHLSSYELVPQEALAPNTTYELTGRWEVEGEVIEEKLRFTTGAGPLEEVPARPSATLTHYEVAAEPAPCDPPASGTCIAFGDPELMVEYVHVDALGQAGEPYLRKGSAVTNLSGIDQGTPSECVRLRVRALNGTYGEPQTLCRSDGELLHLETSEELRCTSAGLTSASLPDDAGVADAGGAAEPPQVDAGIIVMRDPPGTDHGEDDDQAPSMTPQAAPTSSGGGCSATGATCSGWALLVVGLFLRRRTTKR